ncbi:MAG: metal-transporting ATPase, partial [Thermodesulfobacteriota bacterium]
AIVTWTVGAWLITGEMNLIRGIFAALAVLVMGYPCALGMATPLAMIRGGGMAAEKGILMRSGEAFQALKDIKKIVLDKTGTITKGEPEVVNVVPLDGVEAEEVLLLAASTENPSEHPLARAIVEHARGLNIRVTEVGEFQAVPGKGARATVKGRTVRVGSLKYLKGEGVETSKGLEQARTLEEKGKTVVAVADDRKLLGLLAIADTLKEDATEAIRRMKEAGLEPVMITGDNRRTAQAVADQVGIEKVMAEVLPEEKAAQVRALQAQGYRVAMVGDGINDAPALMQADVGIAIGAGTDIAIESADVVLVGERLSAIVDAYHIGRNSYKKTVQNLVLAFAFNGIGVPLAITGFVHPVWAMIAMAASVSTVLLNSFGGRLIPTTKAKPQEEKQRVTLTVPNMHCNGCVSTIQSALEKKIVDVEIEADLEKQLLTVRYSNQAILAEGVKKILIETGFNPSK